MEFINKIKGAVFFIDILGFGALTQNSIKYKKEHYEFWLDKYHRKEKDNQVLAAVLLSEFRDILMKIKKKYPHIKVSQLSDCAFIWSKNITEVILASNNIMSMCISNGIMCRGGLSYGEIIETIKNHNIGKFILVKAVTEAVKLEALAKGCRIMISDNLPGEVFEYDKIFSNKIFKLFQPFTNPLDYKIYDEFKWYAYPFMNKNINAIYDLNSISHDKKLDLIKSRLLLASTIRLHPKYYINSISNEGLIQLKASINFISESNDEPFRFIHDYDWKDVVEKRSILVFESFVKKLDEEKNNQFPFINTETI